MEFPEIILSILPNLVLIAAWTTALIFAVRMVRKGGGKPEKFLLIGVCLMLAVSIISAIATVLAPMIAFNLVETGAERLSIAMAMGIFGVFRSLISLAGIVLMVLAFWKKFKGERTPITPE